MSKYYLWPYTITEFDGSTVTESPIAGAYALYEIRDGSLYGPIDDNVYSTGETND